MIEPRDCFRRREKFCRSPEGPVSPDVCYHRLRFITSAAAQTKRAPASEASASPRFVPLMGRLPICLTGPSFATPLASFQRRLSAVLAIRASHRFGRPQIEEINQTNSPLEMTAIAMNPNATMRSSATRHPPVAKTSLRTQLTQKRPQYSTGTPVAEAALAAE